MRRTHFLLIGLLVLGACRQQSGRTTALDLKAGLDSSNSTMKELIEDTYSVFSERWGDPITHAAAGTWVTRVSALAESSRSCIRYIDSLSAGKARESAGLTLRLSHFDSTARSFQTQRPASIHPLPDNFDGIDETLVRQATLSRIKSDILIAEYTSLHYCVEQTRFRGCIDYEPQAMLNGSLYRKGDTIQVIAWIGAVQWGMDMTLTINGATIPQIREEPVTYKLVAGEQPGHYDLPITMQYRKRDGTMGAASKTFKYRVFQ